MSLKDNKKNSQVKQAEIVKDKEEYQSPYAGSADDLLKEMQGEISPEATPLWQFINDNAPKIAAIVVSLVVIIGAYAFYRGYHENNIADAKEQLALIISQKDNKKVLADLEKLKENAPNEIRIAIELEIAHYATTQNDFTKAKEAFNYVMNEEKYSSLGITAAMNAAALSVHTGENENAIKIYEDIVTHCPKDVQSVVYFQLGEAAEKIGQKDKAIKAYQDGIALFEDVNSTDVIFYKSRIKELSK